MGKETQEVEANKIGDLRGVEAAHRHVAVRVHLLGVGLAAVEQERVSNLEYDVFSLLWNITYSLLPPNGMFFIDVSKLTCCIFDDERDLHAAAPRDVTPENVPLR